MFVEARYELQSAVKQHLRELDEPFPNLFSKIVYLRTYSRQITESKSEKWADTCIRVVEGLLSAYKDHCLKNDISYDETFADRQATRLVEAIFKMEMLPAGRGLWAMGTDLVYERGSAFLYNCCARWIRDPCEDFAWIMDMLMCGVGTGIRIDNFTKTALKPNKNKPEIFIIPDSRQGWVSALFKLLNSYLPDRQGNRATYYIFDYSQIRARGKPLKHFGGTASGYAPLAELLARVENLLDQYAENKISALRFCADVANSIGVCVVSGNIRRSSEILLCSVKSPYVDEFLDLKNYEKYPERAGFGYMSNNSLVLDTNDDFECYIPKIAERIAENGEPGFVNLQNIKKYGRYGDEILDRADLVNPCSEIPLENSEVCNLVELMLPKFVKGGSFDLDRFLEVCELSHFYAKVVSLIPTHHKSTNEVIKRNRRLGISLSGITQAYSKTGITKLITLMKKGYHHIKACDIILSARLNVNQSVRLTTIKPSGTISQLVGITSGIHFPQYEYFIRRMRESSNTNLARKLIKAGVPYEVSYFEADIEDNKGQIRCLNANLENSTLIDKLGFNFDDLKYTNYVSVQQAKEIEYVSTDIKIYRKCRIYRPETLVFEFVGSFPNVRPANKISCWEQFTLLNLVQREWSDNMVSCSISFSREESSQLEHLIALNAPVIKSVSMFPYDTTKYPQMPYEQLDQTEYENRKKNLEKIIRFIDDFVPKNETTTEIYCSNDKCQF